MITTIPSDRLGGMTLALHQISGSQADGAVARSSFGGRTEYRMHTVLYGTVLDHESRWQRGIKAPIRQLPVRGSFTVSVAQIGQCNLLVFTGKLGPTMA